MAILVLSLNQLYGYFIFSKPYFNETYVSLRFDDGLKSQLRAFSLLKEYNLTGSMYIITDKPDTLIEWEKEYYLSWEEIRNLSNFMEIGSHSSSHPDLTKIKDYKSEIAGSKKTLEERGFNVTTFVYPAGNYNPQIIEEARKNYDCASTQDVGTNYPPIRPLLLKDFTMRSLNDIDTAKRVIKKGKWNILTFHDIGKIDGNLPSSYNSVADYNSLDLETFKSILDHLKKENIKVITITEGCEIFKNG